VQSSRPLIYVHTCPIVGQDLRPPSVNRPCGSVAQSWCPSAPSKACSVPSKSMASPAQVPFIAVRFPYSSPFCSLLMGLSSQRVLLRPHKVEKWNISAGCAIYVVSVLSPIL